MKQEFLLLLSLVVSISLQSQVLPYYEDVDLSLNGQALKVALSEKVSDTHTTFLRYTPDVWNALKRADLDPTDPSKVVLIYGYDDTDGNFKTDRTRGVNRNGGNRGNDWNREHVYPKSLGRPNLGTTGAGADAHHLRPSDVDRNSSRGSRKFAEGSGHSKITNQGQNQGNWYPGDEFKGDVARMIMYMYIRYGARCLPVNVAIGNRVPADENMIDLFLEWNAEDPVSDLEIQRNQVLHGIQGNRNPFIDNPAFATSIWGGPQAEDRFNTTIEEPVEENISLRITFDNYPEETSWSIIDTDGAIVLASDGTYRDQPDGATIVVKEVLTSGCYTLQMKDTFGDGLCCGYGSGSYELIDKNGDILVAGGVFQIKDTQSFCVE